MQNLLTLLAFLLMVTVLVAAHEFGHYLVARLFKMEVEEFSIGVGPVKWVYARRNGTEFTVRPLPLGGFVRVKGMVPEEDGSETHVRNGFYSRGPWPRFWMLLAGPVFSILAGLAILAPLWGLVGMEKASNQPVIGTVGEDKAAAKAGLKPGDRLLSVNGVDTPTFYSAILQIRDHGGSPIPVRVERNGKELTIQVTPYSEVNYVMNPNLEFTEEKRLQWKLGVGPEVKRIPLGMGPAVVEAMKAPVLMAGGLIHSVMNPSTLKDNVGGPESMVRGTAAAVKNGWYSFAWYMGVISMSLGIFNLLPISPLDGGQMLVSILEMLRRGRRLSFRMQNWIQAVGLSTLLVMVLSFVTIDRIRYSQSDDGAPAKAK